MIQSTPYQVERLDWEGRKAFVTRTHVDYYTDAIDYTRLKVLDRFDGCDAGVGQRAARRGARGAPRLRLQEDPLLHATRTSATARSTCPTRNCTPRRPGGSCRRHALERGVQLAAGGARWIPRRRVCIACGRDRGGDGRRARPAEGRRQRRRRLVCRGRLDAAAGSCAADDGSLSHAGDSCGIHADGLPLRQLSRRRRPERAALAPPVGTAGKRRANWWPLAIAAPAVPPAWGPILAADENNAESPRFLAGRVLDLLASA